MDGTTAPVGWHVFTAKFDMDIIPGKKKSTDITYLLRQRSYNNSFLFRNLSQYTPILFFEQAFAVT